MNYAINADLSFKEIGSELFIYNRKNSTIYSFNGTGVFIWSLLIKGLSIDEIGRCLCREYEVAQDKAGNDVSDFVKNLEKNGLITLPTG
jgi:hypothetical protein